MERPRLRTNYGQKEAPPCDLTKKSHSLPRKSASMETTGLDCWFCPGAKSYGDSQFLNWLLWYATGISHLSGFESLDFREIKKPPKWVAFFIWWRLRDSNLWPHACEAGPRFHLEQRDALTIQNPCGAIVFSFWSMSDSMPVCVLVLMLFLSLLYQNIIWISTKILQFSFNYLTKN